MLNPWSLTLCVLKETRKPDLGGVLLGFCSVQDGAASRSLCMAPS